MEEDALIDKVIELRVDGAMTAADVHAALVADGIEVSLSLVKKACSKARKHQQHAQPTLLDLGRVLSCNAESDSLSRDEGLYVAVAAGCATHAFLRSAGSERF
jgi:hypothetical protein